MNTQTFAQVEDLTAINDDALIAINGGGADKSMDWVRANIDKLGIPIAADPSIGFKVTKAAGDY
jgi:hypothetical protein